MALSIAEFVERIPLIDPTPRTTKTGGEMKPSGVIHHPKPRAKESAEFDPITQSVPRPTLMTGKADPDWDIALRPKLSAPVPSGGLIAPHGTTKPLGALQRFLKRADDVRQEIAMIARTQNMELPSLTAEMKANGFDAISLSSSNPDDDMEAANLADIHLNMTPYAPDREELAPLLRRIEWEKYLFGCGPAIKYYLKQKEDGRLTLACTDKRVTPDDLKTMIPRFRNEDGTFPDPEKLGDTRAYFNHYHEAPVLALMSEDQYFAYKHHLPDWLDYANPAIADLNDVGEAIDIAPPSTGGPEEIGLHNTTEGIVHFEPTASELWPMDIDATTIAAQGADVSFYFDDGMDALRDFWMEGFFA